MGKKIEQNTHIPRISWEINLKKFLFFFSSFCHSLSYCCMRIRILFLMPNDMWKNPQSHRRSSTGIVVDANKSPLLLLQAMYMKNCRRKKRNNHLIRFFLFISFLFHWLRFIFYFYFFFSQSHSVDKCGAIDSMLFLRTCWSKLYSFTAKGSERRRSAEWERKKQNSMAFTNRTDLSANR